MKILKKGKDRALFLLKGLTRISQKEKKHIKTQMRVPRGVLFFKQIHERHVRNQTCVLDSNIIEFCIMRIPDETQISDSLDDQSLLSYFHFTKS